MVQFFVWAALAVSIHACYTMLQRRAAERIRVMHAPVLHIRRSIEPVSFDATTLNPGIECIHGVAKARHESSSNTDST
jgi:hypothetical protein